MKEKKSGWFTIENKIKIIALVFFLLHTFYVSYPDEFVNLLGGWSILQGKTPYKEFFDHHMPGNWYLATILLLFSGKSFVLFRILWAIFQFGFLIFIGAKIKKLSPKLYPFFLGFLLAYPFLSIFFWNHLFLADSLAGLFISGILWLTFASLFEKPKPQTLYLISLLTFLTLFTSLTYVYFAGVIYLLLFYLCFKTNKAKLKKLTIVSIAPYLIYLFYLILSGSFKDFWFSNFTYNTKLYIDIPNYTRGRFFNPFKMALTLIFNFYTGFLPALTRIGSFDLYFPIIQALTLASVLFLYALFKINWRFGVFYFFLLSFSAPRSNIQKLKETDYQSTVFVVFASFALFAFFYLFKKLNIKEQLETLTLKTASVLLVFYSVFSAFFLARNSYEKLFYMYTQKMPRIYDKDYAAEFIDKIVDKGEYFWIGPYEPNRVFFVKKGSLPGKYPTLLPQFRENEYLKKDFLSQFEKNPPKIIIFKRDASIFMTPATEFGKFFLEWLEKNYIQLEKVKKIEILGSPSEFNIRTDLYIRKDQLNSVLDKLEELAYLKIK